MLPAMLLFGPSGSIHAGGASAGDLLDRPSQVLVGGMEVDCGDEQAAVSGEPLGEEHVLRGAVDVVHGGMPQPMERVPLIKAGSLLPAREDLLRPPLREPASLSRQE